MISLAGVARIRVRAWAALAAGAIALCKPQPRRDEGLDPLVERALADRLEREQRADLLQMAVDSGADEIVAVAHVPVDGTEREAGPLRDRLGGRAEVTLGEQFQNGVEHGEPVPVPPRRAPVDYRLLCHSQCQIIARCQPTQTFRCWSKNSTIRLRASAADGSWDPMPMTGPVIAVKAAKTRGRAASLPAAPRSVASAPGGR